MKLASFIRLLRFKRGMLAIAFILLLAMALTGGGGSAYAHASLVEAVPAADAELAESPPQIALTFSERLEEGLYWIRVFDENQRKVTEQAATMNPEHTGLILQLPKLDKGTYVVTYHIISSDGHPIDGTYLFAVGESLKQPQAGGKQPQLEHLHRQSDPFHRFGVKDILQFASRIAFYLFMLTFTGWLLWSRWFAAKTSAHAKELLKGWGERLQQAYLIVYILFLMAHLPDLIGDGGADALVQLFTGTSVGYAWASGLLLALLSFVVLYRYAWLDYLWAGAVWLAKAFLGHAAAFQPVSETVTLDWLHLFASSVWAGGLLMMLILWRKDREHALRLYPSFSLAALLSILLLVISGVLSVLLFLPDVRYVTETAWGKWLLVKIALVVLVILTAFFIRYTVARKQAASAGNLIRTDTLLMVMIVGIVGIFTYLTPLPANEPLNWHVMGEKIHMTAQISPNAPGVNDFTLKVWLPENLKPKQVVMKLHQEGAGAIAPIEVPLTPYEDQAADESYGMKKYSYKARGPYLPYPGKWKLEIRVLDSNDDETPYEKEIQIY